MNKFNSSLKLYTITSLVCFMMASLISCQPEDPMEEPEATVVDDPVFEVSIAGQAAISFDEIIAEVTGHASTSPEVYASISVNQSNGDANLLLTLNDGSSGTNPFVEEYEFPITLGGKLIYATIIYDEVSSSSQSAVTGTVKIDTYECMPDQVPGTTEYMRLSGEFSGKFADSTELTGTFTDIRLACRECNGICL